MKTPNKPEVAKSQRTPISMSKKNQTITAKSLLKILGMASKHTSLAQVARLYIERERLKEQAAKLKEKRAKVQEEIKKLCTIHQPEQFTFNF